MSDDTRFAPEEVENYFLLVKDPQEFTKKFVEKYGIVFDEIETFWIWNPTLFCYERTDEVLLFNRIDAEIMDLSQEKRVTVRMKQTLLEYLRREGRKNRGEPLGWEWVQTFDTLTNFVTDETKPATKKYFLTNPIPRTTPKKATTPPPRIDKLFKEWVAPENVQMLYEIIAFCMTKRYFLHRIFCLVGAGSNGKSKYLEILRNIIGKQNVTTTTIESLTTNRFEIAKTYQKLAIVLGENDFGILKQVELLNRLSSDADLIGYEFKGKDPFDAVNYAKVIIATNSPPISQAQTFGFYRRWQMIDFPNQFAENPKLLADLTENDYDALTSYCLGLLPGIYERGGFTNETPVEKRQYEYERRANPVLRFLEEQCYREPEQDMPFWKFRDSVNIWLARNSKRRLSEEHLKAMLSSAGFVSAVQHTKKEDGTDTRWLMIQGLAWKQDRQKLNTFDENKEIVNETDTSDTEDTLFHSVLQKNMEYRVGTRVFGVANVGTSPSDTINLIVKLFRIPPAHGVCKVCGQASSRITWVNSEHKMAVCDSCEAPQGFEKVAV